MYIQPTTCCNLHCRTCIRNVWDNPEAHMDMNTFQRMLESLDELPDLTRVVFSGFGEPLTHPNILEMIQAVRRRDLAVTLGSNGLLLVAEMARELIRLGVDRLVVSIDGVKQETYANIRGVMLSQILNNIRALNEAKSQLGSLTPALGIEFVLLKTNVSEIAELTRLASRLNAARVLVI
ncbi:MAG: radical SAM protein [Thermodesulfobacteriota bacterium]